MSLFELVLTLICSWFVIREISRFQTKRKREAEEKRKFDEKVLEVQEHLIKVVTENSNVNYTSNAQERDEEPTTYNYVTVNRPQSAKRSSAH